uniref:Kazal-like domain-containing protein n=1 Tax=Erpetoichthys calabaricus TaxID=27687 RepID=A0A8C4S941_ERPCA
SQLTGVGGSVADTLVSHITGHLQSPCLGADCGKHLDAGCTKQYDPVCGANNIPYTNECVFCKETK